MAQSPQSERDVLEPQGIKAIFVFPLTVRNEFAGFIGFDNYAEAREWSRVEVDLLAMRQACFLELQNGSSQ